jgi:hypothetical protein
VGEVADDERAGIVDFEGSEAYAVAAYAGRRVEICGAVDAEVEFVVLGADEA